jgi:hypothetical protein
MTLTLILLAIGNTLLLMAIRSLRVQRLKERHALLFVAVGVPFLALAVWPDAIGRLSGWLGIEYQTVLLLAVTTFFLVLNFNLLSIVSIQERRITSLAQMVAIMAQKLSPDREQRPSRSSTLPIERADADANNRDVA